MATLYYALVGVYLGGFLGYLHAAQRSETLGTVLLALSAAGFLGAVALLVA